MPYTLNEAILKDMALATSGDCFLEWGVQRSSGRPESAGL